MTSPSSTPEPVVAELMLDDISRALSLESWFEGKTLTVMVPDENGKDQFAKLRLVSVRDTPTASDLRGEPE